jgi:hypothetical protein
MTDAIHPDSDAQKGAVSSDRPEAPSNESPSGQIGHREGDPELKQSDTDFPEPDAEAEHSGSKP